jgi:hypothetical protein
MKAKELIRILLQADPEAEIYYGEDSHEVYPLDPNLIHTTTVHKHTNVFTYAVPGETYSSDRWYKHEITVSTEPTPVVLFTIG